MNQSLSPDELFHERERSKNPNESIKNELLEEIENRKNKFWSNYSQLLDGTSVYSCISWIEMLDIIYFAILTESSYDKRCRYKEESINSSREVFMSLTPEEDTALWDCLDITNKRDEYFDLEHCQTVLKQEKERILEEIWELVKAKKDGSDENYEILIPLESHMNSQKKNYRTLHTAEQCIRDYLKQRYLAQKQLEEQEFRTFEYLIYYQNV